MFLVYTPGIALVGTVTRYRLDGPGIESRYGRGFCHFSLLYIGEEVSFPAVKLACWISKATRAQAHARACAPLSMHAPMRAQEILIAFPRQWFCERASVSRYTYIVWYDL